MPATPFSLQIEQGATLTATILWQTNATPPVPINLTGYSARMMLRTSYSSATPILSITNVLSSSGQIVLGGVLGTVGIVIPASTTLTMSQGGVYDLDLTDGSGVVTRLVSGEWSVSPTVTY